MELGHLYEADFGTDASIVHVRETVVGGVRRPFLVLQTAVLLVMLMAAINVAHTVLAGASTRSEELALRRALGASRVRIVRELAAESLVLALGGALAGLVGARLGLPVIAKFLPIATPAWLEFGIHAPVIALALILLVGATLIFGVLPAWATTRDTSLRARGHRASHRTRGLVACEVALVTVLLVGAGLLGKSFAAVLSIDLAFRTDRVVTLGLRPSPDKYTEPATIRG